MFFKLEKSLTNNKKIFNSCSPILLASWPPFFDTSLCLRIASHVIEAAFLEVHQDSHWSRIKRFFFSIRLISLPSPERSYGIPFLAVAFSARACSKHHRFVSCLMLAVIFYGLSLTSFLMVWQGLSPFFVARRCLGIDIAMISLYGIDAKAIECHAKGDQSKKKKKEALTWLASLVVLKGRKKTFFRQAKKYLQWMLDEWDLHSYEFNSHFIYLNM